METTIAEGLLRGTNEVNTLIEGLDSGTYLDVYILGSERKVLKRKHPMTHVPPHTHTASIKIWKRSVVQALLDSHIYLFCMTLDLHLKVTQINTEI